MRTFATLKNFTSPEGKDMIVRNLNRIMDIVILDINIENSTITFLYASKAALEKTKRELMSIGFPIQQLQILSGQKSGVDVTKTLA